MRFDPRHNSVNALRLGLAGLVLLSHTLKLHGGDDPLEGLTGGNGVDMGTIAVDGFFALSGFLITGSYLSSSSVGRYLWRRCLRILPGFWMCLLVTALVFLPVAQLLGYRTMVGFPLLGDRSAAGYVLGNAGLFMQQYEVRGLYGGEAVNGSLYTLFYEFACYLGLALVGVVGLLRRRRAVLVLAGVVWAAVLVDLLSGGALTGDSDLLQIAVRLGPMFLAGVVLKLWSDRIPLTAGGGLLAAVVLAGAVLAAGRATFPYGSTLIYLLAAPPAVAYLVLLAGSSPRLARIGARRDLSYGLYVYAWPVQVTLLLLGAAGWPVPLYLAAALGAALLLAWASWTFVEAPALAYKSWTPRVMGRAAAASPEPAARRPSPPATPPP